MDHFSEIKPVLNKLSKLNIYDSLDVVSRYMRDSLKGSTKRTIEEVNSPKINAIEVYFADFLIINILKYSTESKSELSLRDVNTRYKICRPVSILCDKVNSLLNEKDPLVALVAYMNNQANIHRTSNPLVECYRYYHIYSSPLICDFFQKKFGFTVKQYFQLSFYIYACFDKCIHRPEPYLFKVEFKDHCYKLALRVLLDNISLELSDLKTRCRQYCNYESERIFHYGNDAPHIKFPLIRCYQGYCCVMPTYILSALFEGIYYQLDIPNASQEIIAEFGHNFETYIGKILEHELNGTNIRFRSEITYSSGKDRNQKSSDWIIWDDKGICFLDCKAKRISIEGKRSTSINEDLIEKIIEIQPFSQKKKREVIDTLPQGLEKDLINFGIDLGKVFTCYDEYSEQKIDSFPYNSELAVYACILTLEDGYTYTPEYKKWIIRIAQSYRTYKTKKFIPIYDKQVKLISARMFENDADKLPKFGVCEFFNSVPILKKNLPHKTLNYLKEKFTSELYNPFMADIETR